MNNHTQNLQDAMFTAAGIQVPGITHDEKKKRIVVPEFLAGSIEEAIEAADVEISAARDYATYFDLLFKISGVWIDEDGWVIQYETWHPGRKPKYRADNGEC